MINKLISWFKPFIIYTIALAILVGIFFLGTSEWTPLVSIGAFLAPLALLIFFWLVMEAAAQADPSQVESPLANFKKKYSTGRDRFIILSVYAILYIVYLVTYVFRPGNMLMWLIIILAAAMISCGIFLIFGTQELRDRNLPKWVKRVIVIKKSKDDNSK